MFRNKCRNVAVLGSLTGDEGKAKIVHDFAKEFDWVIRFNGSGNCGHTVYRNNIKYVHHIVPVINLKNEHTKGFISSGVMVNLSDLYQELLDLEKTMPGYSKKIYLDPDAFQILPQHIEEDKAKNQHIRSTGKGMGPSVVDKMSRSGKKVRDAILANDPIIDDLKSLGLNFKYHQELKSLLLKGRLIFEGAQGIMLDINRGTYPYVSCSEASIAGIYSAGFHYVDFYRVYGITKPYITKVGAGPLPTRITDEEEAKKLRELGAEYGATTGRPRDVAYFDCEATKYACEVGGITHLIITKMDIMNNYGDIKFSHKYKEAPLCGQDFQNVEPEYITLKGWSNSKDLNETQHFINAVYDNTKVPVEYLSCGVGEEDLVKLRLSY